MKTTKETGCYYSVHFGCLCSERDSSCKRCGERLANAVTYALHHALRDGRRDYREQANSAPVEKRPLSTRTV